MVSQLGFGCMRFPLRDSYDPTSIDELEATRMIHYAIDQGVNYFDTAYSYHREMSEPFLGRIMGSGLRNSIILATKMPMWKIREPKDMMILDDQLRRLKTDTIDVYLLHGLNRDSWKKVLEFDIFSFLDKNRSAGKIRFIGFSFHDQLPLFKEIVDAFPWQTCLIHLNYVDLDYQAGIEGLEYAYQGGLAVLIMEPLRGGKLAQNVPDEVKRIIDKAGRVQTPAQFAFRWLYNQPEICCVLSGMGRMEDLVENVKFASGEHIGSLSAEELKAYQETRESFRARIKINCTGCGYCMPCEQKIPISFILGLYNDAYIYNGLGDSRRTYNLYIGAENRADRCAECGKCEEKCPQGVPIIESLKRAHKIFTE